jgi:hypothetical protein
MEVHPCLYRRKIPPGVFKMYEEIWAFVASIIEDEKLQEWNPTQYSTIGIKACRKTQI